MNSLLQDLRYGARMLAKNPGFTLLAVTTLALGIGANTAIFSVVNAVLLQSLPYERPNELVGVYLSARGDEPQSRLPFPPAAYLNLRAQTIAMSDIAALSIKGWPANLTEAGEPERLQGFQVSANLFSLLGVNPELGRNFSAEDDQAGANRVVMISHSLWERRFGRDWGVLNREVTLNGDRYTIIGVMPRDFRFYFKTDVWTPLAFDPKEANERNSNYLELTGRLKPGATLEQATADSDRVYRAFNDNPKSELHVRLSPPQALFTTWLYTIAHNHLVDHWR